MTEAFDQARRALSVSRRHASRELLDQMTDDEIKDLLSIAWDIVESLHDEHKFRRRERQRQGAGLP